VPSTEQSDGSEKDDDCRQHARSWRASALKINSARTPIRYWQGQVQKGFAKARVAAARKLGIRLWIMLRDQIDYAEFCRRGLARQS
jgi:hypothetical protein